MDATRSPQPDPDDTYAEPHPGCADEGVEFNPAEPPEDEPDRPGRNRPAPAPGVPVSDEEYERLKDEARRRPTRDDAPAQEDAPRRDR